jgi:cytochrome c-type biogenesis protein CcmE
MGAAWIEDRMARSARNDKGYISAMHPRTKFMIGGIVVLATSGWLMASSIKQTGEYYLTPSEMAARIKADPTFKGADVRVGARVVPGSITRDPGGREYSFRVVDTTKNAADTLNVFYKGLAPDTFTDGVDVVVAGRATDGTFQATTLLAKCASRYEAAPTAPNKKA